MRILFLTEFFPTKINGEISGGAESRTYYLAKELAKKHEVSVITALLPNSQAKESWGKLKIFRVGREYKYVQTGNFLNRFLFFISAMVQGLKFKVGIIDANSTPTYLAAWLIALFKNCKTVFWIPDVVGFKQAIKHFGFVVGFLEAVFELVSIYFFRADKTIALSKTTKNKLLKLEFDEHNLKVVYPGL
jgi:glycosyltransferase involved in cell wall biosynthesis